MAKKTKDDITLETLYELKDLISEAIENIEKAEEGDPRSLIDRVEDCLVGLNDKTRNIYASMISEHLSSIETSDMIESKKANTSKRAGDVEGLLKATEPYKDWKPRNGILNFHTYVESHLKCMNYPLYEEKGYFVGSGAIESCHRYVMQNRMKQPGQRWNVETGQGILSLKSRYESGNWNEILQICKLNYQQLHMGSST